MRFLIHTLMEFLRDRNYRSLLGASVLILFGGALFYHLIEGWSYLDSVYFSAITLTTIGYGDFSPQTDAGKLFTIIYIGVGVGLILTFINTVFTHFTTVRRRYSTKKKKKD